MIRETTTQTLLIGEGLLRWLKENWEDIISAYLVFCGLMFNFLLFILLLFL